MTKYRQDLLIAQMKREVNTDPFSPQFLAPAHHLTRCARCGRLVKRLSLYPVAAMRGTEPHRCTSAVPVPARSLRKP